MKNLNFLKDSNFSKIAESLILETDLIINGKRYQICEIEFYYWNNSEHNDPFIHKDSHQLSCGKWYFHRYHKKSFKEGTFKGVDLTFGSETSYGGILIRSIRPLTNDKTQSSCLIEGSGNVAKEILKDSGCESMKSFVAFLSNKKNQKEPLSASKLCDNDYLYLDKAVSKRKGVLIQCPRVGLTLKYTGEDRNNYIMKNYRYILDDVATNIKKFKCGIILSQYNKSNNRDDLLKYSKASHLKKYCDNFDNGKTMKFSDFEKKKLNVEKLCQLYGLACNQMKI